MPYISEWNPSDPVQVLVFGQYKVGKTWGAMTFPNPVVMDFDRGIATARNPSFVSKYGVRKIFYETFAERSQAKMGVHLIHNAFDDACRFFDEWMKPKGKWKDRVSKQSYEVGRDMFETWIIDSGTTLSVFAQTKAVIVMGAMKLSQTLKHGQDHGVIIPKIQDYGSERSLIEQFIRMVKDSGKNVVLICHEKQSVDQAGVVKEIVPLLTGKSSTDVPIMFDEVYNMRIKKKGTEMFRYLQTMPDSVRKVGSRYGIPNETEWNWEALQKEICNAHEKQKNLGETK